MPEISAGDQQQKSAVLTTPEASDPNGYPIQQGR